MRLFDNENIDVINMKEKKNQNKYDKYNTKLDIEIIIKEGRTGFAKDRRNNFSHNLGILFAQDRSILGNSMQCIPGLFQKACHLDIRKS